jgi:hypothetical protein
MAETNPAMTMEPRSDTGEKITPQKISSSSSLTGYLPLYSSARLPTFSM